MSSKDELHNEEQRASIHHPATTTTTWGITTNRKRSVIAILVLIALVFQLSFLSGGVTPMQQTLQAIVGGGGASTIVSSSDAVVDNPTTTPTTPLGGGMVCHCENATKKTKVERSSATTQHANINTSTTTTTTTAATTAHARKLRSVDTFTGKWGTTAWKSGRGSTLFLKEAELGRVLKSIPVSPEDAVSCTNLHDCTIQFLERFDKQPGQLGGSVVVATGDGRSYAISYPLFQFGTASDGLVDIILDAGRNTSKPTIFHITSVDGDIFYRLHECKKPEEDPFKLSSDFKLAYFLSPSSIYQSEGGRIIPNSIPIPDPHTLGGGSCAKTKYLTAEEIAARPAKVVFFGATTGHPRFNLKRMPYAYTDRFQLVDQLLGSNISEVHFSRQVQNANLPKDYFRPGVHGPDWKNKGRYLMDVDGNSNAWSAFNWKLCSGGPVIKVNSSSGYMQWYYHLLEHGVHLHVVDLYRQDIEEEIRRVMEDIPYATMLAKNAKDFCCKYLGGEAQKQYLRTMVSTIRDGSEYKDRDWRIKSPPADYLRPLVSPYVRSGPMRRIKQALAGGDVAADVDGGDLNNIINNNTNNNTISSTNDGKHKNTTIPAALLKLAKVIHIREVCVFGSVFPPHMNKTFWNSRINGRIHYNSKVGPTGRSGCDMVVLLEDLQGTTTTEDILGVVSKEYHVIVSLGVKGVVEVDAATSTTNSSSSSSSSSSFFPLRPSEVVLSTWPSVGGVVTHMPSLLVYPPNYPQTPTFPCPKYGEVYRDH